MSSNEKVAYKQIKASPTKVDSILHHVKDIKGANIDFVCVHRSKGTPGWLQSGSCSHLVPPSAKRKSPEPKETRGTILLHSQGKLFQLSLSAWHSATEIIRFSTDHLLMFQELRGKRNRSHQRPSLHPWFCVALGSPESQWLNRTPEDQCLSWIVQKNSKLLQKELPSWQGLSSWKWCNSSDGSTQVQWLRGIWKTKPSHKWKSLKWLKRLPPHSRKGWQSLGCTKKLSFFRIQKYLCFTK